MFEEKDRRALQNALRRENGCAGTIREDVYEDIDRELCLPVEEIDALYVTRAINCLDRMESCAAHTFNPLELRDKARQIRQGTRTPHIKSKVRRRGLVIELGKVSLFACAAALFLVLGNFVLMKETGLCVFDGVFGNSLCCYKTPHSQSAVVPGTAAANFK